MTKLFLKFKLPLKKTCIISCLEDSIVPPLAIRFSEEGNLSHID